MHKRARLAPFLRAGLLIWMSAAGMLCLHVGHAFSHRPAQEAAAQAVQKAVTVQPVTLRAEAQGTARLNLRQGRDLAMTYAGPMADVQDLEQGRARPLALAAGDFDEDGVADLVSGCASAAGGILILHAGNGDALYPNTPAARQRRAAASDPQTATDSSPSPFLEHAQVFGMPEAPEFLAAGDFDNDGHCDVIAAARAGAALYLLRGDGKGGFSAAARRPLPGQVTAMATGEINRADGLTDIVVGLMTDAGPQALVFEGPQGAWAATPEIFALPAAATALSLAQLDDDAAMDLAVAAGSELLLVSGRDRRLSLDGERQAEVQAARVARFVLPMTVAAMAVGNFIADAHHRLDFALLADDGTIHLLEAEAPTPLKARRKRPQPISERLHALSFSVAAPANRPADAAVQLLRAQMSGSPVDDLLVSDRNDCCLRILLGDTPAPATLETGEPAAILPMRLNGDALNDLVILKGGATQAPRLTVVITAPQTIFNVTNTNNSGVGSLRQAILDANGNAGADEIRFNIPGAAPHTINLTSFLPSITQPVTIDATTQPDFAGTPVVELNGAGAGTNFVGLDISATANNCTVRGLVINRFNIHGLQIQGAGSNVIEGNFIGTDPTGTIDRGNTSLGVAIFNSPNNRIGGTTAAARNLISGNNLHGVQITTGSAGTLVQGNLIGTTLDGLTDLGNTSLGVGIFDSPNNTIGGTATGARNLIAGNDSNGVQISGEAADGNLVQGNFIGTNLNGTAALGNGARGISVINSADSNTIGGTAAAARNIISGNLSTGVRIFNTGTTANLVQGNIIGLDVAGTADLGNGFDGVDVGDTAASNTIGGTTAAARNIISGNNLDGIAIFGTATQNLVQGNFIGTDLSGTAGPGNSLQGVLISDATSNTIGGAAAGAGNVIGFNGGVGVEVDSGTSNTIRANSIFSNAELGIDLGSDGVTPNDLNDADGGANNLQNFPVLLAACTFGGSTIISGTLNSTASTPFTLEFFSNSACDNSGFGEGATLIQTLIVTTDASGNVNFTATVTPALANGQAVTATATDPAGNTSEFSQCAPVTSESGAVCVLTPATATNPVGSNHTVTATVRLNCTPAAGATVNFNILSGPNAGRSGSVTTNALGQASFTYLSNGTTGTDTIQASGSVSGSPFSVTAQKTWASLSNVCSADAPKPIPDEDTVTSTLTVGSNITIADVNVRLFITHTFESDLVVTLTSPAGTSVVLFDGVGGGGENFGSTCSPSPDCVIDDEAATDMEAGDEPFVGSFNPGGAALLSAFDGQNAQGTWTLTIEDTASGDVGTLNCWCLEFLSTPTAVKLDTFSASGYDGGVLVEWQTGFEVDNLGFNLYRDDAGRRVPVNPQMIIGSALTVTQGTAIGAGGAYVWWDAAPQGKLTPYWLEAVDLNGCSTWHGPVSPTSGKGPPPADKLKRALLLSQPGKTTGRSAVVESKATLPVPLPGAVPAAFAFAAQAAVKLYIRSEGFYSLTQSDLVAAGLDAKLDPRKLQLYADGQQQPIRVVGEADGRFDAGDAIEFYGVGLDAPATDTRVYWLVAGTGNGQRIAAIKAPASLGGGGSFPCKIERRDRTIYFPALRNGDAENFFGAVISGQPLEQALTLAHRDAAATTATLEVALQGVNLAAHQVNVRVNGAVLGQVVFSGEARGVASFAVPASLLSEGQNTVTLAPQAAAGDVSLVDYLRLTYAHTLEADNNLLKLTAAAGQRLTVGGFSSERIRAFDITDPAAVQELLGQVERQGAGYAVSLIPQGSGQRTLLVLTAEQIKSTRAAANLLSSWGKPANGADLVIITARALMAAIEPLRSARQRQGLSVAVIDVEDLYDEFSFGEKTPQAIKDFLTYAKTTWKKAPRFALLVGEASYDPKNYLGLGDADLVPTRLVDTTFMEAASDDWFADLNSDGLAELALGRLPARSPEEAGRMIAKIIAYDQSRAAGEALLVADADDSYSFTAANARLRGLLPGNLRASEINRGQSGSQARAALLAAIGRGQRLVNYSGHGAVNLWRGNLLTAADAAALENQDRLPVFVLMTCLNGYFFDAATDSLAESLLKNPRGGAVAVWASTAMTLPDGQSLMNQEFYRQLFNRKAITLGEAVQAAKAATRDQDVRRTWVLLGDPTTRLR
ncbi:MAG TPA: C25 family cysteine peptidase [Blastocatellia bacterium]|nr:C25 family cysteine peptidase [Blastocatellia bacterium]